MAKQYWTVVGEELTLLSTTCPRCGNRFSRFVRNGPFPINITCPYCQSLVAVSDEKER